MGFRPAVLNIQEFLLAYALDGPAPPARGHGVEMSDPDHLPLAGAKLRAEIERHADRTMTVLSTSGSSSGMEAITRCGVCPKEPARPCSVLRVLALPYAQHPAYRPEWHIAPPDPPGVHGVPAQRVPADGSDRLLPLPHMHVPDLPPPGNARRQLLRQFGIPIGRFDFTEEELAQRGNGDPETRRTLANGSTPGSTFLRQRGEPDKR
jgi:hypothetical protein